MSNKISIALCTYNGEKYIEEQLTSIINQTRRPDEIIICDDLSLDGTIIKVKEVLKESNIEWNIYVNQKNLGVTKNFEKAINLCTGDIIFTCDQDDVWRLNKISTIEANFDLNPKCRLVFTDAELVDSKLKSINRSLWQTTGIREPLLNDMDANKLVDILLNRNIITGATMAFKKELIDKIMPISNNWIHDYWIGIIASLNGQVIGISDKLILYRQHEDNVIGVKTLNFLDKVKKYYNNYDLVKKTRLSRLNSMSDLWRHIKDQNEFVSTELLAKIESCLKFWRRKAELDQKRNFHGAKIILTDTINGGYKKYYSGFWSAVLDIMFCCGRNK